MIWAYDGVEFRSIDVTITFTNVTVPFTFVSLSTYLLRFTYSLQIYFCLMKTNTIVFFFTDEGYWATQWIQTM